MNDLFDLFGPPVVQPKREAPPRLEASKCPHGDWRKTLTIWSGEDFERLTWTCKICGTVRGRA